MTTISEIRPSQIAGTWYLGNPQGLAEQVDEFIGSATIPELKGEVVAVITPHAGHRYSGRTAGYAFRCVSGLQFDVVVVVSPMHSLSHAPLLTSAHSAYQTPLGNVWIDQDAVAGLEANLQVAHLNLVKVANDREHSLEIELPFLQRSLAGEFRLLPLMLHTHSPQMVQQIGLALAQTLQGRSALLVASTDLSHFYPETIAAQLDEEALHQMAAFSPEGVLAADSNGSGLACGAPAVAAVLWAARELGAKQVKILHRSTSGEETRDFGSVVGYGAAVVLKGSSS